VKNRSTEGSEWAEEEVVRQREGRLSEEGVGYCAYVCVCSTGCWLTDVPINA